MTSRHKYIGGSVLVALLGIGIVVYLSRRKPTVNVSGILTLGDPTVTYQASGTPGVKSDVQAAIDRSNAALAADDLEQRRQAGTLFDTM